TFLYLFQQLILCLGSTLSIPFILTKLLCADGNQEVTAQLLCISMFMCGVATLLQTTTGVRLGIIQGGSHTFIGPIAAMMALDVWECPTVLLSVIIACILCYILTVTDAIPFDKNNKHFHTRTDSKQDIISSMPWFYFPLPCKQTSSLFQNMQVNFGTPTVSVAGFVGMLGATLSAVIESTGDYFLCARISNAKPPPPHAVNRGHATEGFASFISGLVGAGHGTISYSGNIGEIGITKIASRVVFQTAGAIMVICGLIGKFGAVLSTIPDPIIGGTLTVLFGMVTAAGISTLRFVDMTSSRNAAVLATSLIMGLMIPAWVSKPENRIDTGIDELDQVLQVLMGTAILIGGIIAFILDNTLPGTQEERGILKWLGNTEEDDAEDRVEVNYDIPLVTRLLERVKCCSYFPISPTFHKESVCPCNNRVDENEFTDIQMSEKL
ncbi:hypothetical protein FSP39_005980, partial [Pinctada imbricata]